MRTHIRFVYMQVTACTLYRAICNVKVHIMVFATVLIYLACKCGEFAGAIRFCS